MVPDPLIESLPKQLIQKYQPKKVILFGSQAKGTSHPKSDIDLCVITDTKNKRALTADMYLSLDCEKPFDLILYTEDEWKESVKDPGSFASLIKRTGVEVYGR